MKKTLYNYKVTRTRMEVTKLVSTTNIMATDKAEAEKKLKKIVEEDAFYPINIERGVMPDKELIKTEDDYQLERLS